jgi:hypothetical protein
MVGLGVRIGRRQIEFGIFNEELKMNLVVVDEVLTIVVYLFLALVSLWNEEYSFALMCVLGLVFAFGLLQSRYERGSAGDSPVR